MNSALHIAEARVVELSSGISLAQFLMVFLLSGLFSSNLLALSDGLKKRFFRIVNWLSVLFVMNLVG